VLSLVLVTESEQTQRFITMLIVALLVFAGLLFLLTLWYWRSTNPKRRVRRVLQPAGIGPEVDPSRPSYPVGDPRLGAQGGYPAGHAGYAPGQQPGYDPRYASPRQGDGRFASPDGRDPYAYGQGDGQRRRLLQDDEHDPYQARRY